MSLNHYARSLRAAKEHRFGHLSFSLAIFEEIGESTEGYSFRVPVDVRLEGTRIFEVRFSVC